jgi:hypothetical protein
MQHGILFYILLGAGVVLAPAMTDRLLKDRVADWLRIVLGLVAAALIGVAAVLIARVLGL